jgi:acetoin utilization protein AcuC
VSCSASAIWDEGYLAYDFGEHPMNPVRLELTIRLARELGVLDRLG